MAQDRTGGVAQLTTDQTATGASDEAHEPNGAKGVVQAVLETTSGAGTANVKVQGTLDGTNYVDLGEISLANADENNPDSDVIAFDVPYKKIRTNTTAISGTGAKINSYLAVEV